MGNEMIFISYAHADKAICSKICKLLDQYKVDYWKDEKGIPPAADDFNELIEKAIVDCKYFFCVWTPGYRDSDYCKKELNYVLNLEKKLHKEICILQMLQNLDPDRDFPPGCCIQVAARNRLFCYEDSFLEDSIKTVASRIYQQLIKGVPVNVFRKEIKQYIQSFSPKMIDDVSSLVSDSSGETVSHKTAAYVLKNSKNVFIHGDRGLGKTTVVRDIYTSFFQELTESLDHNDDVLYIPIYVDLELLWSWNAVVYNNVLYTLCKSCNIPYCTDESIRYIVLLDGEMRTSRGYLPKATDALLDKRSGVYSLLIAQTEKQVLHADDFVTYRIKKLQFPEIVKYIVKNLGNNIDTVRFFRRLFNKAFADSAVKYEGENIYFSTVRNIYNIFAQEEKETPCHGITAEDFYSLTLAESTQKGRLPRSFPNENAISIWRKLIKGNEVFRAIRNPYYLNWLIKLFQEDNELVFPYRLKTLQVKICQTLLDDINLDPSLKERAIRMFLIPLAKLMKSKDKGNIPIPASEFQNEIQDTDFDRIKKELTDGQIISSANNDIVFRHDFLYEYFLNYADPSNADRMEDRIRICPARELPELFISYIQMDEPFEEYGTDAIEIAVDIILDERDSFNITAEEKKQILTQIEKRLNLCRQYKKRASILNGVAKLFKTLDLSAGADMLDIEASDFWYRLSENTYLSRFPITCYHFDQFVDQGYTNPVYWEYGIDSLRLKDGKPRNRPLREDSDRPVFHIANHPVVGITWYEASAYCQWLGNQLPEGYTARLPKIKEIRGFLENWDEGGYCNSKSCIQFGTTTPITTFSVGLGGPVEVVGNVWEWSLDTSEFYGDNLAECYGGCWSSCTDKDHLLTTYPVKLSSNNVGFRVIVEKNNGK